MFCFSSFSQNLNSNDYCHGSGVRLINNHIELIKLGVETGEIDDYLFTHFQEGVELMIENYEIICGPSKNFLNIDEVFQMGFKALD
jgi:hypothetical protein